MNLAQRIIIAAGLVVVVWFGTFLPVSTTLFLGGRRIEQGVRYYWLWIPDSDGFRHCEIDAPRVLIPILVSFIVTAGLCALASPWPARREMDPARRAALIKIVRHTLVILVLVTIMGATVAAFAFGHRFWK